MPHVVLVAQCDVVPAATVDRYAEIVHHAKSPLVHVKSNRERRAAGEFADNRHGSVHRAIVLHKKLVGQAMLPDQAVQLLWEIPLAVIGAKDYRDGPTYVH